MPSTYSRISIREATIEGPTPVAPAHGTAVAGLAFVGLGDYLEVGCEGGAGFDGDDLPVVLPDALEEAREQAVALGGGGLGVPELGEAGEELLGAGELRVGGWCEALKLVLEGLAAHDVLGFGEVAEDWLSSQARPLTPERQSLVCGVTRW